MILSIFGTSVAGQSIILSKSNGISSESYNSFVGQGKSKEVLIGNLRNLYSFDGTTLEVIFESRESPIQSDPFKYQEFIWISTYDALKQVNTKTNTFESFAIQSEKNEPLLSEYHIFELDSTKKILYTRAGDYIWKVNLYDPINYKKISYSTGKRFITSNSNLDQNVEFRIVGFPWFNESGFEYIDIQKGGNSNRTLVDLDDLLKLNYSSITISAGLERDSNLWMASSHGLVKYNWYNPLESAIFKFEGSDGFFDIDIIENTIILSTTNKGLVLFDVENQKFTENSLSRRLNQNLSTTHIQEIFVSPDKWIFASQKDNGISIQQIVDNEDYYKVDFTGYFYKSLESNLWAQKDSNLIEYSDDFMAIQKHPLQRNEEVINIYSNTTDRIEVTTNKRHLILRSDYSKLQSVFSNPTGIIYDSHEISPISSQIVTSTGLYEILYNGKEWQTTKSSDNQTEYLDILYSNDSTTFYSIDPTSLKVLGFDIDTTIALPSECTSFIPYNEGYLLGTMYGLYKLTSNFEITPYNQRFEDSFINNIWNIDNHWWIHTSDGLFRETESGNLQLIPLNFFEGMPAQSPLLYVEDQGFYYRSNGHMRIIRTDSLASVERPRLILHECQLNNEPVSLSVRDEEIIFPSNTFDLKLRVYSSGLFFSDRSYIKYRFIDKKSDKWEIVNGNDLIHFKYLEPSQYTLELIPVNAYEMEGDATLFSFTILPPYYATWWFRSGAVLSLIGLGFGANYLNTRRKLRIAERKLEKQRALSAQREKIADDLHDELGTELSKILYLSDEASETRDQNKKENLVKDITQLAASSIANMRDMLWVLEQKNDTLDNLLSRIRINTQKALKVYPIDISFDYEISDKNKKLELVGEYRQQILLIIKEGVHNIIKHSGAKNVQLSAVVANEILTFKLQDDGKGFDLEKGNYGTHGRGMASMKKRAEKIGAEMEIKSSKSGTAIEISLLLDKGKK